MPQSNDPAQPQPALPPTMVVLIRRAVAGLEEAVDFSGAALADDLPHVDDVLRDLRAWLTEHDSGYTPEADAETETEPEQPAPSSPRWFYFHDSTRTHRIVAVRADCVEDAEDKLNGGPFFEVATWDDGDDTSPWSACDDAELDEQGVERLPDAMDESFVMRHGDDAAEAFDKWEALHAETTWDRPLAEHEAAYNAAQGERA